MSKELLHGIVFVTFLCVQCIPCVEGTCALDQRSTESFRLLFIGKCLLYQTLYNVDEFCSEPKNCSHLWDLFFDGFAYQPLCNASIEGYQPFIDAAYHNTPRNKHIFWSGVYEFVSRYTYEGKKRTAIDDTLTGYLADNLNWCGNINSTDGNEVNVTSCPPYDPTPDCPMSASAAFWAMASINYAKDAKGSIEIMLNSSQSPAFRPQSFFTTKELPQLKSPTVTGARVILVHSLGAVPKENCSSTSVSNLTTILTSRGIPTVCVEQPWDVVLLQSADFLGYSSDCQQTSGTGSHDRVTKFIAILAFLFTSLIF